MAYQLLDYRAKMTELRQGLEQHVAPYASQNPAIQNAWAEIGQIYDTKLNATKPEVMVYGIYNAGKSSIINELLGEDKAKVQDVPTTDTVTYYEWNGYRLADTPGVAAPIKHDQVTQEHLKKADVVIFVMSTTGSNERRENYMRMKDIADSGKKIIIVLNDKNGDLGTPEGDLAIQKIKMKVVANMKQVGIPDVEKKYFIVVVNADRARKGRLANKPALRDKSNIAELANVIMQELKKANSFSILALAVQNIETLLGDIIQAMENDSAQPYGEKGLSEILEKLRQRQKEIRESVNGFIDHRADILSHELPGLIWSMRDNSSQVDAAVREKVANTAGLVQRRLESEIRELIDELMEDMEDLQMQMTGVHMNFDAQQTSSINIQDIMQQLQATLSGINEQFSSSSQSSGGKSFAASAAEGAAIGAAANEAVKQAAKTVIGKTLLKTTVGKYVSSFIPVVGPLITGVSILSSLFGGSDNDRQKAEEETERRNEAEERRAAAEAQARQEIMQRCQYMAADMADTFKTAVSDTLADISQQMAQPFKEQRRKQRSQKQNLQMDLMEVRKIADAYDALRYELQQAK